MHRVRRRSTHRVQRVLERSPHPVRTAVGLAVRTVRDTVADRVPGLAAEVALFTLISLPALILVVLGSLGFVADALGPAGQAELDRIVFDLPRTFFSDRTYEAYADLARQVLSDGRADVVSIGLAVSLWTGSRAVNRTLETVSIAYDVVPRPGWRRRLLALGLTAAGLVAAVAVLPLLVLGPRLVRVLAPESVAGATLSLLGALYWPTLGLLVVAGVATLFHIGVPWRTPWHRDLPGALLAMAAWLAAAAGLRAYLALAGQDDQVYERLSTPIAVVLWLYVSAVALLLGAELNSEIERTWPTRPEDDEAVDGGVERERAETEEQVRPGPVGRGRPQRSPPASG